MTVLAVVSPKGGVGKTTLALNLSYSFARRGWKTLLIDGDPQGGIGLSLRGGAKDAKGLAEVLRGTTPLSEALLVTKLPELHLLPSGRCTFGSLWAWSEQLADAESWEPFLRGLDSRYDIVVIDTPPGLSGPARGVLMSASHVVSPLQAEPLALRALPQLLEALTQLHAEGRRAKLAALVLMMVQSKNRVSMDTVLEAFQLFPNDLVIETVIPRDPVFLEASGKGVPVALLDRRPPPVAAVFDLLAAELEPRLDLVEKASYDQPLSLLD
jgi:chromosome partitioning protein